MILNTLTTKDFLVISHPLSLLGSALWHMSVSYIDSTFMTTAYKVGTE